MVLRVGQDLREGDGEVLMDLGDGFSQICSDSKCRSKSLDFSYAAAARQSDQNLAGKPFYGMLGLNARQFPTHNCPKKDTVNHFGTSQMVLELISVRQSFPNNLI